MRHVSFNPIINSRSTIHELNGTKETLCHEPIFDPERTFDGHMVARGFMTDKPANCGKCRRIMLTELRKELGKLTLPQLEKVAESLGYSS